MSAGATDPPVELVAEELGLSTEKYLRLLRRFVELSVAGVSDLERALADRDLRRAERAAHTIKGSAATLRLPRLALPATRIEGQLRAETRPHGEDLVELKEALTALAELLG